MPDKRSRVFTSEFKLEGQGCLPSVSRLGRPYDNAMAESFMRTRKTELAEGRAYRNLAHATGDIGGFIGTVYNHQRLRSALAHRSPEGFERVQQEAWVAVRQPMPPDATCP